MSMSLRIGSLIFLHGHEHLRHIIWYAQDPWSNLLYHSYHTRSSHLLNLPISFISQWDGVYVVISSLSVWAWVFEHENILSKYTNLDLNVDDKMKYFNNVTGVGRISAMSILQRKSPKKNTKSNSLPDL